MAAVVEVVVVTEGKEGQAATVVGLDPRITQNGGLLWRTSHHVQAGRYNTIVFMVKFPFPKDLLSFLLILFGVNTNYTSRLWLL